MLLPFEGMGVDTSWELQLPKAANPFDYRAIADVLLTIEYTALSSPAYRQQVIKQLDRSVSGERMFSLRDQFADVWYELNNADAHEGRQRRMVASFSTRREDFPPHVEDLRIQHVTLHVARRDGFVEEVKIDELRFTPDGRNGAGWRCCPDSRGIRKHATTKRCRVGWDARQVACWQMGTSIT